MSARILKTVLSLLVFFSATTSLSAQVRMTRVDEVAQEVTLRNFGAGPSDASTLWLCIAPGTYQMLSTLTIVGGGDLMLSPGEEVTVVYTFVPAQGGVGLYLNAAGFGNPLNMSDYMQYGGVSGFREPVADLASIWTPGTFASGATGPYVYTGNGTQNGAAFWSAQVAPVPALPLWGLGALVVLIGGTASAMNRRRNA